MLTAANTETVITHVTDGKADIGSIEGTGSKVAAQQGRRDDALALLAKAGGIAEASGAQGILRSVEQARTEL